MRETQEPRRIGPFRLATELLAFVERQLDAVRRDLGPRVAGWARLVVVALTLAAVGGLVFSLTRLARRGNESVRELLVRPAPDGPERQPCSPADPPLR